LKRLPTVTTLHDLTVGTDFILQTLKDTVIQI
jgi:hypothetical protein